uniref:Uncharacterized protein n=1 Tax=Zea mays TaxID=4577 RepID=A0A804Q9B8_MAIZE
MTLAVGTTSGLLCIYKLREHIGGSSFHFVSEFKQEVCREQAPYIYKVEQQYKDCGIVSSTDTCTNNSPWFSDPVQQMGYHREAAAWLEQNKTL